MEQTQLLDKNGNPIEEHSLYERLYFVERFYRRHKKIIVGIFTGSIIGGMVYLVDSMIVEHNSNIVNEAYYNYANNIEPEKNIKIIESKNSELFSLIQFSEALKNGDQIDSNSTQHRILKDIAQYQKLSQTRDITGLNNYSYGDGAIYRDLAIVLEAYVLIKSDKVTEARNRLAFIDDTSSLKELANYLNHFGVVSLADKNDTSNSDQNNGQSFTNFMDSQSIKNLDVNRK